METNIDLEVLTLCLGVQKTCELSSTPPEVLKLLLGNLTPEKHKFFVFVKECLLKCIEQLKSTEEAEAKLGVSSYALDLILDNSSERVVSKPRRANSSLRRSILEDYKKALSGVAEKYGLSLEQVSKIIS